MNDNDVIRALECCISSMYKECQKCPLYADPTCRRELQKDAVALINRQQAEIERLDSLATAKDIIIEDIQKRYNACFEKKSEIVQGMSCTINKAKSEARKDFAERVVTEIPWYELDVSYHSAQFVNGWIINLSKEMEKEV